MEMRAVTNILFFTNRSEDYNTFSSIDLNTNNTCFLLDPTTVSKSSTFDTFHFLIFFF